MLHKKLALGIFSKCTGIEGSCGHYFTFKGEEIEVCLESCLNGYCGVTIYDLEEDLLMPKVCTNLDMSIGEIMPGFSMTTSQALPKALRIANEMIIKLKIYDQP